MAGRHTRTNTDLLRNLDRIYRIHRISFQEASSLRVPIYFVLLFPPTFWDIGLRNVKPVILISSILLILSKFLTQ